MPIVIMKGSVMVLRQARWGQVIRAFIVLIACLIVTIIVWGAAQNSRRNTGQVKSDQVKTKAVQGLGRLRLKYAAVRSVHLEANATIKLYGATPRSGVASYEYWAEGERYRIKCYTDPHLGLLPDTELAYDGKRFYFLDRKVGILSFRQQDEPRSLAALPNPLFLPVDFLSGDDDACPFCALRLPEFKSESLRWNKRLERLSARSLGKDKSTGNALTELEMPGGILEKREFKLRLHMAESADGSIRPMRIERVGLDGKSLTLITLDNFVQSQLGEFPQTISLQSFDDESKIMLQIDYSIGTLEVDQPIANSIFQIAFDEAEGVWDSDAKRFVKEKEKPPKARPR